MTKTSFPLSVLVGTIGALLRDANGNSIGFFFPDCCDPNEIVDIVNSDGLQARIERYEKLKAYEADIERMVRKLHDGTLHVLHCNGNHDARVGDPRYICNCPLGVEIKDLRHAEAKARYLIGQLREALKWLEVGAHEDYPEGCPAKASQRDAMRATTEALAATAHVIIPDEEPGV
jgi:hypothetical protein